MRIHYQKMTAGALLVACIASSVGCYPAAYPPANDSAAFDQDAKGYSVPPEPVPQQQPPRYAGIDPGLVVAGVAAAGLLGYAIGNNRGYHHHHYYGPRFYRPVPYWRGHYGPRYYR